MLKKTILTIIDAIAVLIIAAAVIVLSTVLLTGSGKAPSILGYSVFRVMTGSMEPEIPSGSLIVVRQVEPSELETGDVISFYSRDPSLEGSVNTHRITAIEQDEEHYYFTTKGDANNVEDHYVTQDEDLVGEVVFASYTVGVLVRLLSNPLVFIPLVLIPLAVILILNLHQTIILARKIAREEEEAAVREALEEIRRKKESNRYDNSKYDNSKYDNSKYDNSKYNNSEYESSEHNTIDMIENKVKL